MKPSTIIFIGPQGSGKGTQVEAIGVWLEETTPDTPLLNVQTGMPLRALAGQDGYTASIIKDRIEAGKLVPTVLMSALVMQEFVAGMQADSLVVMDGYPRDLTQAKVLDDVLAVYSRQDIIVLFLDVQDEEVTRRMLDRGRTDDTEAVIKERLATYHAMTEPLLEYYEERDGATVVRIDGAGMPEEVTATIKDELTKLLS